MRVETTAPLVLDACINTLKERPIKTRFHPDIDKYFIDTYIMARIIWHNSDLQAKVLPEEAHLCSIFIRELIKEGIISSVLTNNKYIVIERECEKRKSILVRKKRILEKTVGRKPKYLKIKNMEAKGVAIDG